jgi:hypothetical protein
MKPWRPIETAPEDVLVETKIDDDDGVRNVQSLRRSGRLWFIDGTDVHVFYTPTHWRERECMCL